MKIIPWVLLLFILTHVHRGYPETAEVLPIDFESPSLPANLKPYDAEVERIQEGGNQRLRIVFHHADWPQVFFQGPETGWDWSAYLGVEIEVTNPEQDPIEAAIRVDNQGAPENANTARKTIPPGETVQFRCEFVVPSSTPFWGMRGIPGRGPLPQGTFIDPTKITAFQLFLPQPDREHTLLIDNIRLWGDSSVAREGVPLPFVDRYGQYIHADWPGKIHSDQDLVDHQLREEQEMKRVPNLPDRDSLGAWTGGGRRSSTGWFRTEKIEGKWWLISPEGRLFFSNGIDCVGFGELTFVEGREEWFEWLPDTEGPFKPFLGTAEGVHSMAERIGGKGRTFSFHSANVFRRQGEGYRETWKDLCYRRFASWGFNTIGNWSDASVLEDSPLAFVASTGISGNHRRIEGAEGYWGKIHDVFDPEFDSSVSQSLEWVTGRFSRNSNCIGYFVDNELSWGSEEEAAIAVWALRSPSDQPCRRAFMEDLKSTYPTLADLNLSWESQSATWEELRVPSTINSRCREDLDRFVRKFCDRYFGTVARELRKSAPNQLYLGCRFSDHNRLALESCAQFADILSFNIYRIEVDRSSWAWLEKMDKPAIIGEFHFGAMDRGMFHPGLVETSSQTQRGEFYSRYVASVAQHPNFVGCHWFQYIDEPITGRVHDGENYNIGFVDVADTPYPELVKAARDIHGRIYPLRSRPEGSP